ncbi:MAG: hypothetical protein ACRDDX_14915 [Cellulosilyticaceae bacterium]
MAQLLTKQELATHLARFREILGNFDYSSLKNIRFFNLDSLYTYMETIKDNPFQLQYKALQEELDYIQPYLPFVSSERAAEFLTLITKAKSDQEVAEIKKDYTQKLRRDFIDLARTMTTMAQWDEVTLSCEEIRLHKEEMCLASS